MATLTEEFEEVQGIAYNNYAMYERERKLNARLIELAKHLSSAAPGHAGDGCSPIQDEELIEIVISGKVLNDLRAALSKAA